MEKNSLPFAYERRKQKWQHDNVLLKLRRYRILVTVKKTSVYITINEFQWLVTYWDLSVEKGCIDIVWHKRKTKYNNKVTDVLYSKSITGWIAPSFKFENQSKFPTPHYFSTGEVLAHVTFSLYIQIGIVLLSSEKKAKIKFYIHYMLNKYIYGNFNKLCSNPFSSCFLTPSIWIDINGQLN